MKLIEITNSLSGLDNTSISDLNSNKEQQFIDLSNKNDSSFSTILKNSIDEVNNTQIDAYNAMEEIATGKVENLQEAMQRIQEAELSLKLGLEVKNKALGAYKQIMAMQI